MQDSFFKKIIDSKPLCFKELGGELTSIKDQEVSQISFGQGDAQYGGLAPVLPISVVRFGNDTTMYRPSSQGWEDPSPRASSQENLSWQSKQKIRVSLGQKIRKKCIAISLSFQTRIPNNGQVRRFTNLSGSPSCEVKRSRAALVAIQDLIVHYWRMKDLKRLLPGERKQVRDLGSIHASPHPEALNGALDRAIFLTARENPKSRS